jgi:Domain of unknown function (DUF4373)
MPKVFGEGLRYMQLDVDVSDNDKIDMLMDKYGHKGFAFWTLIHARIFKNSYYWEQEDVKVNRFCRKILRVTRDEYDQMVTYSLEINVFDQGMYKQYNILTSDGIQERYLVITRKWSKVKIITAYILPNVSIYSFQLALYTADGHYLGYKCKNTDEIISEEFVPRRHVKQSANENRTEEINTAIKEYTEPVKTEPAKPQARVVNKTILNGNHKAPEVVNQIDFHQDEQLSKDVLEFFGFNQLSHSLYHIVFGQFMLVMEKTKKIDEFRTQFYAYKEYKNTSNTIKHGFENFIGRQSDQFVDGKWQSENWTLKLKECKLNRQKQNGKESRRGYTPEGGYGQI